MLSSCGCHACHYGVERFACPGGFLLSLLTVEPFLLLCLLLFLVGLFLLHLLLVSLAFGVACRETLVHLLKVVAVVVELFEVELAVHVYCPLAVDGIAQCRAIFHLRASLPSIGAAVRNVAGNPVEDGKLVYGQLVADLHVLVVVKRPAEMPEAMFHGILPHLVFVGVKVLVYLHVRLLHLGLGSTLESEVQSLEDVPSQLEVAVPEETLAEGGRNGSLVLQVFQVSLLQFVVSAVDVRAERQVLWREGNVLSLHDVQPFALPLDVLEGFPWFPVGAPRVVHAAFPVLFVFVDGGFALGSLCRVAIVEGEVRWVVGHWMLACCDVHLYAAEREVLACLDVVGQRAQRISFPVGSECVESVAQQHVCVERIVLRANLLLAIAIVYGYVHLCLFG